VSVTAADGARIEIGGVGVYETGVVGLEVPPGTYPVSVTKPGFKSYARTIAVRPGESIDLRAALEPLPAAERLAEAEMAMASRDYDRAATIGRSVLAAEPQNPRAHVVVGQSLYQAGRYAASTPHLIKAVDLGEEVRLPVKHHHVDFSSFTPSDDLCSGHLTFRRTGVSFESTDRGDGFSLAQGQIAEVVDEGSKTVRVRVKLNRGKGLNDQATFYNVRARVGPNPGAAGTRVVHCDGCDGSLEVVHELMVRMRR
jgi:hypothetical protein